MTYPFMCAPLLVIRSARRYRPEQVDSQFIILTTRLDIKKYAIQKPLVPAGGAKPRVRMNYKLVFGQFWACMALDPASGWCWLNICRGDLNFNEGIKSYISLFSVAVGVRTASGSWRR